jgi:signal transduction histidine kinase
MEKSMNYSTRSYSTIDILKGSIDRSQKLIRNSQEQIQEALNEIRKLITDIVIHEQAIAAMERDVNLLKNA